MANYDGPTPCPEMDYFPRPNEGYGSSQEKAALQLMGLAHQILLEQRKMNSLLLQAVEALNRLNTKPDHVGGKAQVRK